MSSEVKITISVQVEDEAIQESIQQAIREGEHEAQVSSGGLNIEQEGGELGIQAIIGQMGSKNPMALMRMIMPFLGPAALVLLAPMVLEFVVNELTKPGNILDTRFRRDIEKENLGFYNRQLQWDTQYGYRNVIVQGYQSFLSKQGNFHASTFRDINEGTGTQYRLSRIEIDDKALGIRDY